MPNSEPTPTDAAPDVYVVKMLKDTQGVDRGKIHPELYKKDEQYEIGEGLYSAFKSMGVVTLVKAPEGGDATVTKERDARPGAERMTPEQLKEYAEKHGVKLPKGANAKQIAKAVQEHIHDAEAKAEADKGDATVKEEADDSKSGK